MASILGKLKKARQIGISRATTLAGIRLMKYLNALPLTPPTIYIELTNRCNLKCIMCDRDSMTREQGQMDMALFRQIIDNASRIRVPEVKLNRFGEPFLNPSLVEMVKYAKAKGIPRVYFTTNATLMTEEKAKAIVEAGLDAITCSVDGATAETYQKVRGIPHFEKITRNVERLAEIKASLGRSNPVIVLNTILMKETEPEILSVFRRWEGIVDRVNVIPVASYGKVESLSSAPPDSAACSFRACDHLFDRLMVFWDGRVTVCCGDINGALEIGRFPEQSLEQLWKNERMTRLRRLHRARQFDELPVCRSCDGIKEDVFRNMQKQRLQAYQLAGKKVPK
jgi:radical SAM protein with 4Fe4S-binding SPASM domain